MKTIHLDCEVVEEKKPEGDSKFRITPTRTAWSDKVSVPTDEEMLEVGNGGLDARHRL